MMTLPNSEITIVHTGTYIHIAEFTPRSYRPTLYMYKGEWSVRRYYITIAPAVIDSYIDNIMSITDLIIRTGTK